jgi:hypothetical protein
MLTKTYKRVPVGVATGLFGDARFCVFKAQSGSK